MVHCFGLYKHSFVPLWPLRSRLELVKVYPPENHDKLANNFAVVLTTQILLVFSMVPNIYQKIDEIRFSNVIDEFCQL